MDTYPKLLLTQGVDAQNIEHCTVQLKNKLTSLACQNMMEIYRIWQNIRKDMTQSYRACKMAASCNCMEDEMFSLLQTTDRLATEKR